MRARVVEVSIQVWNEASVESLAGRVERCGAAISELGLRGATSVARASELAKSLRAAGKALAYVDEEDVDALFVVVERLDNLEREAQGLLALWQDDDSTRQYDEGMRQLARQILDEERTRVRPRIIPPALMLSRRAARRG